jgi:hypothetical protein
MWWCPNEAPQGKTRFVCSLYTPFLYEKASILMSNLIEQLQQMLSLGTPNPPKAPKKQLPGLDEGLHLPEPPPVEVNDPSGRLSGRYNRGLLQNIANEAKLAGVDPLTALAMSGQETTFGKYGAGPDNPLHLDVGLHGEHPFGNIAGAMQYFKKRSSKFPEDEALAIQSYNGLGKIQGGSEVAPDTPMYGGQPALHGLRDKPYGKAVMGIRDMLASQPFFKGLK